MINASVHLLKWTILQVQEVHSKVNNEARNNYREDGVHTYTVQCITNEMFILG